MICGLRIIYFYWGGETVDLDSRWAAPISISLASIQALQGYFAHKKQHPPLDHHRAVGIGLLWGPMGGEFLTSEVPL